MSRYISRSRPGSLHWRARGAAAGLALTGAVALSLTFGVTGIAVLAGAASLTIAGYLALRRFALFVGLLLVIRPALDVGRVGPIVGVGFLMVGVAWLFVRWRSASLWPPSPIGRALLCFAGVCTASSLWSPVHGTSFAAGMKVLTVALMFVVVEQLVLDEPGNVQWLLVTPLVSLIIPAAFAAYQLVTGPSRGAFVAVGRIQGTFTHPNPFANYLVVVAVIAYGVRRVVSPAGTRLTIAVGLLAASLVLLTYARVAWAALLVALMIMILRDSRRLMLAFVCIVVLVGVTVPSIRTRLSDLDTSTAPPTLQAAEANSLAWRVDYWKRLGPEIARLPLTGSGLESTQLTRVERLQPHNTYLQVLLETGVLGLVGFGWVLVSMLRRARFLASHAREPWDRAIANVCIGVGSAYVLAMFTENLVTTVAVLWYVFLPFAVAASPVAALVNGEQRVRTRRALMELPDLSASGTFAARA